MSNASKYLPRQPQIDAIHLNREINKLFEDNLLENLQSICPRLYFKVRPELDLIIQSAIWFGSIYRRKASFGHELLALSYASQDLTTTRLSLHFLLSVLPKYLKSLEDYRVSINSSYSLYNVLQISRSIALAFSILNFFKFLKTGRKPSLIEWALNLNCVTLSRNQRDIGYKYLERELLWGGFMETFGLIVSLINFKRIQMYIKKIIPASLKAKNVQTISSINSACSFCGEKPTLPHYTECRHLYCYYCISANTLTDPKFCCVVCDSFISGKVYPVEFTR